MDGHESGCTDLHLACGDSVLVAQVLDDMAGTESMIGGDTGARRHRRLQARFLCYTSGSLQTQAELATLRQEARLEA